MCYHGKVSKNSSQNTELKIYGNFWVDQLTLYMPKMPL